MNKVTRFCASCGDALEVGGRFCMMLSLRITGRRLFSSGLGRARALATVVLLAALLFIVVLILPKTAHADDGGWQEAGGTFDQWISSEGAFEAVIRGVLPAAGVTVGVAAALTLVALSGTIPTPELQAFDQRPGAESPADVVTEKLAEFPEGEIKDVLDEYGDITFIPDALLLPAVLWPIESPADLLRFSGDSADNLRELCGTERPGRLVATLLMSLYQAGRMPEALTEKDLDTFLKEMEVEEAPRAVLERVSLHWDSPVAKTMVSLARNWPANRLLVNIARSKGDVHILFPLHPAYELPAARRYGRGVMMAIDELRQATEGKFAAADAIRFAALDEAATNPNGFTLGKALRLSEGRLRPAPNRYKWNAVQGRWTEPENLM